jgi:hypothetical protein
VPRNRFGTINVDMRHALGLANAQRPRNRVLWNDIALHIAAKEMESKLGHVTLDVLLAFNQKARV